MTELERLREENAHLRRELGISVKESAQSRLQLVLRMTGMEAKFLLALYSAGRRPLGKQALMNALYYDRGGEEPEIKIVDVYACTVRRKLPPGTIETVWGSGYALSLAGAKWLAAVLNGAEVPRPAPPPPPRMGVPRAAHGEVQVGILRVLADGPMTAPQIRQKTGATGNVLYARLHNLRKAGFIDPSERTDKDLGGRLRKTYRLTEAGRRRIGQ